MNITVRGEKIQITESMKEYAKEKLSKLSKYLENPESVNVNIVVKVRNFKQKVEVTIPLNSYILRAEELQEDFYAAVDMVIDKIERQIRKNKTKLQSKMIKEAKEIAFEYVDISQDEEEELAIIKRKKIEVKPMSEEEAIIQMELIGHQFYLFKDADTLKPALVYKRTDGHYGIIETE